MTTVELNARQELKRTAARRRLDDRATFRAIDHAVRAGLSQRQISSIIGSLSQASVQRIIRRLAANPSLLCESPAEVIDRRAAGDINDQTMMEKLVSWKYTFGGVPRVDGVATDAYMSGDWDEIESAYYRELLSDEEFATLVRRPQAMIENAAPST